MIGFAVTTALAGALLAGCTTNAAPPAAHSASQAERGARQRQASRKRSRHAEAAVLAEPRNAAYRSTLASAYLDAGRFASAETTFKDAIQLGDSSGAQRAEPGAGACRRRASTARPLTLLNEWEGEIATADLGLALALAGQPERGIHLMSNAHPRRRQHRQDAAEPRL